MYKANDTCTYCGTGELLETGAYTVNGVVKGTSLRCSKCSACVMSEVVNPITAPVGVKHDQDKAPMELVPPQAIEDIANVMAFGAKKYGRYNWTNGISYSRLLGAAMRHLLAFSRGEDLDKESGLSHLAHLGACVVMLLWTNRFRSDLDDRFKDPTKEQQ